MYSQTVKDEYVPSVDLTANPSLSQFSSGRNLRNVKIFLFVTLKTEAVRTFQNPQRTDVSGAVMKRYPRSIELRITAHKLIILVCVNHQPLAMREDQAANGLWVNQQLIANEHLHHPLQR